MASFSSFGSWRLLTMLSSTCPARGCSLAMQHGHTAIQLGEDGLADIIGVLADDLLPRCG